MKNSVPPHVLVVDDEPIMRELLKRTLRRLSYSVKVASDGEEALQFLAQDHFDLVFTDYCMPGIPGDELAQTIKKRFPDKPVVMITATPPNVVPLGVDRIVGKPFRTQEIGQIMLEWTNREPMLKTASA